MILDILKKINDSGTTVMVITHDNILVRAQKDLAREIHLKNGRVESDTKDSVKKETKKEEKDSKKSIDQAMNDKIEEKKSKMDPNLAKLSKELVEKLERNAIYNMDLLLGLTQSDLKNLKLKKKEEKELREYIKNYLSKK
jgi:ABC-type multidrug transport system ATPase subunit